MVDLNTFQKQDYYIYNLNGGFRINKIMVHLETHYNNNHQ